MKLPNDKFINDISASLMDLRTNLNELAKNGVDRSSFNQLKKAVEDFSKSMTLEDHEKIEDVVIELETLSTDLKLPLAIVHNLFINALEDEIEEARKRAGERTNVRSSKLKEARALIIYAMDEYETEDIESSENIIEAVEEAVNMTRAKLSVILGEGSMTLEQIKFAIKANRHGSNFTEFIFALNKILMEYKEAENS